MKPYWANWMYVDEQRKFAYCPIPKVASSSLDMWFFESLGVPHHVLEPKGNLYHIANLYRRIQGDRPWQLAQSGKLKSYFKFILVRNPFPRLVSVFLNKRMFRPNHRRLPVANGMTFHDFITIICAQKDLQMDGHWSPQYLYFDRMSYNFIGKFENLEQNWRYLAERLNLQHIPRRHLQQNQLTNDITGDFSRTPPDELQNMAVFPDYEHFYTKELRQMVRSRYRDDFIFWANGT
jgi:hypothetical protein